MVLCSTIVFDESDPAGADLEFAPVKSASRTMDIIEILSTHTGGLSFTDLQELTGWPRSSLHGLVRTMTERSHLSFDSTTQRYRIGVRLWEAGQSFFRGIDLAGSSMVHLNVARDRLDETIQLALLDGVENVYIAKAEASHILRLASFVGARLPAYATGIGKVLLAGLDEGELTRRLSGVELKSFTPHTITNVTVLRDILRQTRARGFGTDDQEFTLGLRCFAVPVFDHSGQVVASMSASIPSIRVSDEVAERVIGVLAEEARELSIRLGYRPTGPLS